MGDTDPLKTAPLDRGLLLTEVQKAGQKGRESGRRLHGDFAAGKPEATKGYVDTITRSASKDAGVVRPKHDFFGAAKDVHDFIWDSTATAVSEGKINSRFGGSPVSLAVSDAARGLDPETQKFVAAMLATTGPDGAERVIDMVKNLRNLSRDQQRDALKKAFRQLRREKQETKRQKEDVDAELEKRHRCIDAIDDIVAWAATQPKLRRADGSKLRELRAAVRGGRSEALTADKNAHTAGEFEKEVFVAAEPMVVTHDWAAAFAGSNLDDPAIKLPYDVCAFEFQFGERRVIAIATEANESIVFGAFVEQGNGHWLVFDVAFDAVRMNDKPVALHGRLQGSDGGAGLEVVFAQISKQIVAVCIALDAEVAVSEAVREPYQKAHGKNFHAPARTYNVVSLVRRTRAAPLEGDREGTGARRKLHFRRGHWRHYPDHRTWLKWMLVGDPDLGWVEKEYRL